MRGNWRSRDLTPDPIRAAGAAAWDADKSRSENPYPRGTPEWASWDAGWYDRQNDNE